MLSSLREVQVGILREKKIDLERKKRREEREKELEKLKAWAPGLAPIFCGPGCSVSRLFFF